MVTLCIVCLFLQSYLKITTIVAHYYLHALMSMNTGAQNEILYERYKCESWKTKVIQADFDFPWPGYQLACSSALLLLFLTSPVASASLPPCSWDSVEAALQSSPPPPLVCRLCKIWSLGRFQDVRVAIQRIRPPKSTRRTPSTFTKTASGGESLYVGSFLWWCKKKTVVFTVWHLHCVSLLFNHSRPIL